MLASLRLAGNISDMGAQFQFRCPVDGCEYTTNFRLGMGEELDPSAHAARLEVLRVEHPNHLTASGAAAPTPIAVGDAFPLDMDNVGDCSGEYRGGGHDCVLCPR
jgi:hypothetical protein